MSRRRPWPRAAASGIIARMLFAVASCPWDGFEPANLHFCEEPLCALVTEPANTWTNVGFLVAGVLIVVLARRERRAWAGLLGPIAIATGVCSAAFHATSTLAGQLLDQNAMFLESALFVTLELRRWRGLGGARLALVYAGLCLASGALLVAVPTAGIALFIVHIATFAAFELAFLVRDRKRTRYGALASAAGVFALSYGLWWLDKLGIVCAPGQHVFTAHGAWHLLGALSFYFWYRHFAQFEVAPVSRARAR